MISTKLMTYLEGHHRITCPQDIIMLKHQIDMVEQLGFLEHTSDWDYGVTIIKHDLTKIGYMWFDDDNIPNRYADSFNILVHEPEMDLLTVEINVIDDDNNEETFQIISSDIVSISIENYS